jgi:hypothetical protein
MWVGGVGFRVTRCWRLPGSSSSRARSDTDHHHRAGGEPAREDMFGHPAQWVSGLLARHDQAGQEKFPEATVSSSWDLCADPNCSRATTRSRPGRRVGPRAHHSVPSSGRRESLSVKPHCRTSGPRGFGPVIRAGAGMPERQMPGSSFHGADGYVLLCAVSSGIPFTHCPGPAVVASAAATNTTPGQGIALRFDRMLSAIVSHSGGRTGCVTDETAVCKNSDQARQ